MSTRRNLPNQKYSPARARQAVQDSSPPVDLTDVENAIDALDLRVDALEAAPPDYTTTNFNTDFATKSTTDLAEGTNLYYTTTRANTAIDSRVTKSFVEGLTIDVPWSQLTSVPSTFTPSTHTHLWADITDKPATFTPSTHTHLWADITDKPAEFSPSAHTHIPTDIIGVFDPDQLGTGTPTTSKYLRGDGTWQVPPSSGGGASPSEAPVGDFDFVPNASPVFLDGTHVGTLPDTPLEGDRCTFITGPDFVSLTMERNGNTIEEETEDMTMTSLRKIGGVLFDGSTWRVF